VRLFDRIREKRGLNYGDYAYIEYFPEGMYRFEPEPNLARQQQIFQIWIRPVQPETAHFALRLGIFELERLVREGMTDEDVAQTKNFLAKYVNLLTKTKRAELGVCHRQPVLWDRGVQRVFEERVAEGDSGGCEPRDSEAPYAAEHGDCGDWAGYGEVARCDCGGGCIADEV
jgi:hypothetical protein